MRASASRVKGMRSGELAVAPRIQTAQLALDQGVARRDVKGAFHVPDRRVQFVVAIMDDAQANTRHKVFRIDAEHALKDILRRPIVFPLQQRFAHQPIDFDGLGVLQQDVTAVLQSRLDASHARSDCQFHLDNRGALLLP